MFNMSRSYSAPFRFVSARKLLATLALSAVIFSCGGGSDEPAQPADSPDPILEPSAVPIPESETQESNSAQARSDRPQFVFLERPSPPPPELAPYLAESEAGDQVWRSEVLQVGAQRVLQSFLEDWLRDPVQSFDAIFDDSFTTTELRPKALEPVPGERAAKVWRSKQINVERLSRTAAAEALQQLHGPFQGTGGQRAEVDIYRSFPGDDGHFTTEALIVLSGAQGEARVQVSTSWRTRWLERVDAEPKLMDIELLTYEEVQLPKALFGDLTSHVFGAHPFFRSEFLLGVDDYYNKMDRLVASSFIGSQGLAVGDANGDGLDDIFVAQQDGIPNRLFLRTADGRSEEVSTQAGIGFLDAIRSALFLDLDNDGDQDLAMAYGANILIVDNDGRGAFSNPRVLASGGNNNVFSMCAADPDGDGDLDIYACHYVLSSGGDSTLPAPYYDANNGSPNHYWRNEGDGSFTDATEEVGLDVNNRRFSFSAIWEDFDLDGDQDLYVTNDFGRNNLYRNEGGKFTDVAEESGAVDMAAGMGATVDDYDHDGDMDLYISNMFMPEGPRIISHGDLFGGGLIKDELAHYMRISRGNTLLRNKGDGTFEDVTLEAGVWRGGWAWGATFGDFNNDGWSDIYVPNGFTTGWGEGDVDGFHWYGVTARSPKSGVVTEPYTLAWGALEHMVMHDGASYAGHERNRVYMSTGDGRFADIGAASSADFLEDSRAVAMLDWDDDGRLDMVMKNRTAPRLRLLRNQDTGAGDFLAVELQGVTCNRDAIGARVEIRLASGVTLRRTLHAGEGYLAQSSKRLHFGLGRDAKVQSLTVHWPDNVTDIYEGLAANQRYRAIQGQAKLVHLPAKPLAELANHTTEHLQKPADIQMDRLVLAERLPLGLFRVPSFEKEDRTLSEFLGVPVLLNFWATYGDECALELRRFQRRQAELKEAGVFVVPMTIDDPEDFDAARAMLDEAGLSTFAGHIDKKAYMAFEVILHAVLGHSMDTPLPTSFLIDEQGNLCAIYLGPVRIPQLLSDVQALRAAGPDDTTGQSLMGGYWLSPRVRSFRPIVRAMNMLGERSLSDHFRVLQRSR